MKIWKKLSLALCLCFTFSSVATSCDLFGGEENSSSTQTNSSSSMQDEEASDAAKLMTYLTFASDMVNEFQSAKISFEISNNNLLETGVLQSNTEWKMLSGEAIIAYVGEESASNSSNNSLIKEEKLDYTNYNAKINVTVTSVEELLQPEVKEYYIIDGYVYEYYADTNTYDKYNESLESIMENLVHAATQGTYTVETLFDSFIGVGIGEDIFKDYDNVGEEIEGIAELDSGITDNGMWMSLDASKKVDELFDFLRTVDKNTTYGDILDYALKQISPDLTTASIIEELYPRGRDTVSKLVEELDQKSKEKTEKTLQENLDTILKNEAVQEAINSLLKEENEELANDILNFKIADFLKEDSTVQDENNAYIKNGDLTLNDLSKELVSKLIETLGEEGNEVLGELGLLTNNVNWGLLIGAMEMVLDWKPFENIAEDSTFYKLLEQAQALEITDADARLDFDIVGKNNGTLKLTGNFGGNRTKDGAKTAVGGVAELLFSEFKEEKTTIALPQGATLAKTIYSVCPKCGEAKESVTYRETEYMYYCDECFAALPSDEVTE